MAWLIDEGYDVIGFMADVGQEEVGTENNHLTQLMLGLLYLYVYTGL